MGISKCVGGLQFYFLPLVLVFRSRISCSHVGNLVFILLLKRRWQTMDSSMWKTMRRCESNGGVESLPGSLLIQEILMRLDIQALCSVSCVSKPLRLAASQALSAFSSPSLWILSWRRLAHTNFSKVYESQNYYSYCLYFVDTDVMNILDAHVKELKLLKCSSLSSNVLASVGNCCPNLRLLVLELIDTGNPGIFNSNLDQLLQGCSRLEV